MISMIGLVILIVYANSDLQALLNLPWLSFDFLRWGSADQL